MKQLPQSSALAVEKVQPTLHALGHAPIYMHKVDAPKAEPQAVTPFNPLKVRVGGQTASA